MKTKFYSLLLLLITLNLAAQEVSLIKDINPSTTHSIPDYLTVLNDHLIFSADDGTHGKELWLSDGTTSGTILLKDIRVAQSEFEDSNSNPEYLTVLNDKIYFFANDGNGEALWETNGTIEGTNVAVKLDENGETISSFRYMVAFNNKLYFQASTNSGIELFLSDGTENGTKMLKDINTNPFESSQPKEFKEYDGKLYFTAFDPTNGEELWVTDGTENGTQIVKDLAPGFNGSSPKYLTVYNNKLYFKAGIGNAISSNSKLWESNGTAEGTKVVENIVSDNHYNPNYITVYKDNLYFIASIGANNTRQLWKTDASVQGTSMITEINSSVTLSDLNFRNFTIYNDKMYFMNGGNNTGFELFESDGTAEGTKIAIDINPEENANHTNSNSYPERLTVFKDKLFFSANNGYSGIELFAFSDTESNGNSDKTFVPDDNFERELITLGLDTILDDYVLTSNIQNVTNLFIKNKEIESLEGIEDFTSLQHLNCSENSITTLNLQTIQNLITLDVRNNNLSSLLLNVSNIQGFHTLNNANLTCIQVNDLNAVNNFAFTDNPDYSKDSHSAFSLNCNEFKTYVPDDNFEQKLITLGLDDILDDYVTTSNINVLTELNIAGLNIDDLTGIEDFDELITLNVSSNNLTTLNTSGNRKLVELIAGHNQLTTITTSNNLQLKKVDIQSNQLESISFTSSGLLEVLNCKGNSNLSEITLTNNTFLKELDVSYCGFTNLSIGNQRIEKLNISYNNIVSFDARNLRQLETFTCKNNEMVTLQLLSNVGLKSLIVRNNNLISIDLSDAENLEELWINDNNLTNVNLKNGVGNLSKLTVFTAINNESLNCIEVEDITYANENLTNIDAQTSFTFNCDFVGQVYIPDNKFEKILIELNLDTEEDNYVLRGNIKNIKELNLSGNNSDPEKIMDLTGIEAFVNLQKLNISFNNLNTVDLSKNIQLEELRAQFSSIYLLKLPNSQTLKVLDIHTNNISDLDVSNYVNLIEFQGNDNFFSAFNFSTNTNLEILRVGGNSIIDNSLHIKDNINLKELDVSFTGLTGINLENNTNLETLKVDRNNLQSLNVSKLRQLTNLDCTANNLTVLELTNNIRLTGLQAKKNNLTCIKVWDIDFANKNWSANIDDTASFGTDCYTAIPDTNFEQALIDLGYDTILDGYVLTSKVETIKNLNLLSKNISDLTGIEAFTAIESLTIKGNNLTTINISNNTNLKTLYCNENKLTRLDISNNINLEIFDAINNNLTCIKVADVSEANRKWANDIDASVTFSTDCDEVWTVEVDEKLKGLIRIVNGIDVNNDGEITLKEAKEFTGDLDLSDKNIEDVKGLQAFTNIKSLNLSGNNLKDLSALTGKKITLISKTTGKKREISAKVSGLETLIISNNNFETLNLEELKNLKVIDISNNPNIATISIKNGNNANITSFDATNTPNLTCILVDDKKANYLSNWAKDSNSNFVSSNADCRATVLSIADEFSQKDVKVFPNPVSNFLTIEITKEFDFIEVYNSIGKRVLKTKERKIDFSSYTSGIYFLKIIADHKLLTKKIMKN
ncbi:MAG: ELWxxDGT repeat protein [Polaribacter sp.]